MKDSPRVQSHEQHGWWWGADWGYPLGEYYDGCRRDCYYIHPSSLVSPVLRYYPIVLDQFWRGLEPQWRKSWLRVILGSMDEANRHAFPLFLPSITLPRHHTMEGTVNRIGLCCGWYNCRVNQDWDPNDDWILWCGAKNWIHVSGMMRNHF